MRPRRKGAILCNEATDKAGYREGIVTYPDGTCTTPDGNHWARVGLRYFNVHPWNGYLAGVGGYGIRWEIRDPHHPESLTASEKAAVKKLGVF